MNDNKRIAINTGILFLRLIITSIVGLVATRWLLESLGITDYGIYNVVGSIVVMMSFLNTVMVSTTYRFIAFEMGAGNHDGINKIFNISFMLHVCLAILLILLSETLGRLYIYHYLNVSASRVKDAMFVFQFSVLGAFFMILSIPYQGLVTAKENFIARAVIQIIKSLLQLTAVYFVTLYLGDRLRYYSILMMFVILIPSLLFYTYCRIKYSEYIKWNFQKRWNNYKEMISFSGWIMLGAGANVGKTEGAALIINSFFGTVLNASFGIANQVNALITMVSGNLSQAAIPQIIKNFSGGNMDRSTKLTIYISKYSFFLLLLPSLPILLETDFILKYWLKDVPIYSSIFIQLMIVYALIESLNAGVPALIQATGKIKWFQIINSIILLASLPISYFLFLEKFSPPAILVVFIIARAFTIISTLFLLKKIIKFDIMELITKVYFKVLIVVLVLAPLFLLDHQFKMSIARFVIFSFVSLFLYFFVVFFGGLEKFEQKRIMSLLKRSCQ